MSEDSPILVIKGPIELRIELVDLYALRHHEELIPELLRELTDEIEKDGYLKHPVIVDEKTLVVIDGSHRIEALKALGCRHIPACLVKYEDPKISVGCWYRTFRGQDTLEELVEELRGELGLRVEPCGRIGPSEVGEPPVALVLTDGKSYFKVVSDFEHKDEAWELVKKVEGFLRSKGLEVGFETEEDALAKLESGQVDLVLMTPRIGKEDVIKAAVSGRVFPHKATRHVIPARPLFLNIPLEALRDARPREVVEEELRKLFSSKKVKKLPPGLLIEDRRYEEEVYIIEP